MDIQTFLRSRHADPDRTPAHTGILGRVYPSEIWNEVYGYVSGAQINYLIEGLDLVGTLVESGNTSGAPRMTDWEAAKLGCYVNGTVDYWGAIDRVAHHPSLPGWTDQHVHCER